MPFSAATAIAIYKAQGVTKRDLTVYNGDGSGSFLPGTVVNIVADVAPLSQVFDKWVGQTSHIANINMPNTTICMPFSGGLPASVTNIKLLNIIMNMLSSGCTGTTVEATYKDPGDTTYALTVTKGTGGGDYLPGTEVSISANAPAAGYIFDKWIGQSEPVENINNVTTKVYMSSNDLAVEAAYIFLVTATANAGGAVSPAFHGVSNGNTTQFTATAAESSCSLIDTVSGDCPAGTWSGNTYTTGIITRGCLVTFNFECAHPPPPPAPCSLSISPYSPSVTGDAGTTTYNVSNAVGYTNISWTASVWQGGDWFTITSGASGTDSGTITCSFTANPSTAVARVAYIGIVPNDGSCQGHVGIMVTQNPLSASSTLLWTKTDGAASVWSLDTPGNLMSSKTYGPFTGWTADNFHREAVSEGTAQMLWNHINGTALIQFMNDMGDMSSKEYGPEAGWTAVSYHLNSNGTAQMLWNHTDGTASVWTLDVRGDIISRILYGPYTDETGTLFWTAADYRRNSDGTANMLWVRTDSYTSVWALNSSGDMTSRVRYGPFTDASDTYLWYAKSYLRNSDGTANMLWSREGYASVWTLNSSGSMTSRIHYGPYLDWAPRNFDKIR